MADRTAKILKASKKVKEQYLQELLTKVNDGTVTKKELEIISKLESDMDSSEKQSRPLEEFKTNVHGVSKFFGVTIRTVQLWSKNSDCPKEKHGMYDLKAVFDWWQETIGKAQDSFETEDVKLGYWKWKKEAERIKVETLQGKLIPEEKIIPEWASRMSEITSGLQALSDRLPPLLDGKTRGEQQTIISKEVWSLRDNYCRTGVFCPVSESTE